MHLIKSDAAKDRKKRVTLKGQVSSRAEVTAGVSHGSIIGTLLFLIYINDLTSCLSSNVKQFVDDTTLLSVTHNINTIANEMNNDLTIINSWAHQWKMCFNPNILANRLKKTFLVECQRKKLIQRYFLTTFKVHNLHLRNTLV